MSHVLHARLEAQTKQAGKPPSTQALKNATLREFGLTGRQFNAIQVCLDGQRSATQECRSRNIEDTRERIKRLEAAIADLKKSLDKGRYNKDRTVRKQLTANRPSLAARRQRLL